MSRVLNITNGDSSVAIMQQAGIEGEILPWRDILHDGPVPEGLSWQALSDVRADFIIGRSWGEAKNIRASFQDRNAVLDAIQAGDKVLLWFEHDLYDQLQILQILDWFANQPDLNPQLTMICTDHYLGMVTPEEMKALRKYETPVTQAQMTLAQQAWAAFRAPTPARWAGLLSTDTSALPFLHGAVLRQLQEYPSAKNGLSRTANVALEVIQQGEVKPGRVFAAYIETEERKFLGDLSFWQILQELLDARPPLISLRDTQALQPVRADQLLGLTEAGQQVLAGELNALDCMELDRWIGGVHLSPERCWCWVDASSSLSATAPSP